MSRRRACAVLPSSRAPGLTAHIRWLLAGNEVHLGRRADSQRRRFEAWQLCPKLRRYDPRQALPRRPNLALAKPKKTCKWQSSNPQVPGSNPGWGVTKIPARPPHDAAGLQRSRCRGSCSSMNPPSGGGTPTAEGTARSAGCERTMDTLFRLAYGDHGTGPLDGHFAARSSRAARPEIGGAGLGAAAPSRAGA